MSKQPWYLNVRIWINTATATVAILRLASQLTFITPHAAELMLLAVASLNIILHVFSSGAPLTEAGATKARALRYEPMRKRVTL